MKFDIVWTNLPFIFQSTLITIQITLIAFVGAQILAWTVGLARSYQLPKGIGFLLGCYIEVFRGTPLLIQLFFIYYGLPTIGITMDSYTAAFLGLSLNSGAYLSEVIRGAVLAVDSGQREAAHALGYTGFQTVIHIVVPQAFRISLPSLMNGFSAMLKESSLVSVLAITELTRSGQLIYTRTSRPFEIYLTLGLLYFVMTYGVSLISKQLEKRTARAFSR